MTTNLTEGYLRRIGRSIKAQRDALGYSLRDVAALTNEEVSHDLVRRLENGKDVAVSKAAKVAFALGMRPGSLFNPFALDSESSD